MHNKGPSIYDVHMEGEESQAHMDACGRGRGKSAVWTSKQKIIAHLRHCALFSCRSVGDFWTRILSLD